MNPSSKFAGGVLLVSGTTIGAGMLALPVCTGMAGFWPSLFLLFVYWGYMTFTAFLMLEVNLWMKPHTNLISMARHTLGPWGEALSWLVYLFLLYSLTTAYIAGSGPIVIDVIQGLTGWEMPHWLSTLPLLLIFGFFVCKGTQSVDYVNRLLMAALAIAYAAIAVFLTPHVEAKLLSHVDLKCLNIAVSIVAVSFGFHIIIPSLTSYLDRDTALLKKVILVGSLIPLAVYVLWEFLTLGIIPLEGPLGIQEGYANGANGAHLLTDILGHSFLALMLRFFAFFAIVTSFLGVSLSLSDFLADGLKIQKTPKGKALLYALTFLPPLLFTFADPRAFLSALDYAGAFGVVILLGLLPAAMVWQGRYRMHLKAPFKVPGGKPALLAAMLVSVLVIVIEIINKLG